MPLFTNENIVEGTVTVANPGITDTELRATPVPVTIPTPVPVTDNGGSLTVDGTVAVSGSVAVTGPLTDTELRATPVPVSGTVAVSNFPGSFAGTATVARVATSASATTILAANASRNKFIIATETGTTYIKLGTGATDTDYTVRMTNNTTFEMSGYTGAVSAVRSTGTGNVQVTELV